MYDTIMRVLVGALTGLLCAILPLVLGYLLDKTGGGVLGAFTCVICGGLFGFLNKSAMLTVIVTIIVILFLTLDKNRPSPNRQQSTTKGENNDSDEESESASESGAAEADTGNEN